MKYLILFEDIKFDEEGWDYYIQEESFNFDDFDWEEFDNEKYKDKPIKYNPNKIPKSFYNFLIKHNCLDKFINNYNKFSYDKNLTLEDYFKTTRRSHTPKNFIFMAFQWVKTTEGENYWSNISSEWRKELIQLKNESIEFDEDNWDWEEDEPIEYNELKPLLPTDTSSGLVILTNKNRWSDLKKFCDENLIRFDIPLTVFSEEETPDGYIYIVINMCDKNQQLHGYRDKFIYELGWMPSNDYGKNWIYNEYKNQKIYVI